jgi:hypothetical protein
VAVCRKSVDAVEQKQPKHVTSKIRAHCDAAQHTIKRLAQRAIHSQTKAERRAFAVLDGCKIASGDVHVANHTPAAGVVAAPESTHVPHTCPAVASQFHRCIASSRPLPIQRPARATTNAAHTKTGCQERLQLRTKCSKTPAQKDRCIMHSSKPPTAMQSRGICSSECHRLVQHSILLLRCSQGC